MNISHAILAATLAASLAFAPIAMASGHGGSHSGSHSHSSGSHSHSGASHNKGSHSSHASHAHSSHAKLSTTPSKASTPQSTHHKSTYAQGVARDSHGKIARSQKAKDDFKHQHPCPSTGKSSGACPGYVIDHVKPLKRGGEDKPSNMQWQTKEAAKQKDQTE